ncbi:MAG: hypothetical protein Phog2KO_24610 [Phototrophicaceae bacterium]
MLEVKIDENNPNITRWGLNRTTTWDDFTECLDNLIIQAENATEAFSIIATTTGQMPRGNALSQLRRLINIVGDYDTINHFIIINHKRNPVGQAFMTMALQLFSKHDKLKIVLSEEEALALT